MSKVGKPKSGELSEKRRHPASTLTFFILQYLPSYQCLLSLSPVYYNGNLCLFLCCFLFEFSAILRRFSLLSLKLSTAVLDPASSSSNVILSLQCRRTVSIILCLPLLACLSWVHLTALRRFMPNWKSLYAIRLATKAFLKSPCQINLTWIYS